MIPNSFKKKTLEAFFNAATIKVMLLSSSHVDDQDNQEYIDDVSANEISGTGYTAGGATLANLAITQDNTDNEGVADADNVTWSDSTITARYAAIYKDTGTPSTSPIIEIIDFGEDKSSSNGPFTIEWNSDGFLNAN